LERFDFLKNKYIYLGLLILGCLLGYYAYQQINSLPKPGTIPEFIKFYFKNPGTYFKITIISLIAFAITDLFGFATILIGASLEDFHILIRILIIAIGAAIMLAGLYFLGYFAILIISILLIGFLAMIFLNDDSNYKRRY